MMTNPDDILSENARRHEAIHRTFNPITGEGSIGSRFAFSLPDTRLGTWMMPDAMAKMPFVKKLIRAGSMKAFLCTIDADDTDDNRDKVLQQLIRIRFRYDFPFWAAMLVWIKNKGGGADVHFRLSRPQRKLVEMLEAMRMKNQPIRVILLKARQWGGSTTIQLYMAWLQMVHRVGLNSLIIAHQNTASDEINRMFQRMIDRYPVRYLYKLNESYAPNESKWVGVGLSGHIHTVPQRNCNVKVGTAERPDSCRGGDYNLVHLSEVGVWKSTEGKTPKDIVQSACSGILYKPYTMIVMESTAKGTGSFFHTEWIAAKMGKSMYAPLFIAWFDIDQYSLEFDNNEERADFARWLWLNRDNGNVESDREEPGRYYWYLWELGATLEAINWYMHERAGRDDHQTMAGEFPSDDVEAFAHAGERVFDMYKVEKLRKTCRAPQTVGDVYAKGIKGKDALNNVRFREDHQGSLWVWYPPESDPDIMVKHRYLVVVDIGGTGKKADWSVIVVFDRLNMVDDMPPTVVAQWYGHIDMYLLAWKAAQVARWYNDALLVIESNTLETHDKERDVDGDQSGFILNKLKDVYPNLYARHGDGDAIIDARELRYGFHTNVKTKPEIISVLKECIYEQLYIERDARCVDEYLTYEKENGAFNAILGKHDDLLMTRAIGLYICFTEKEMPRPVVIDVKARKATAAARRQRRAFRTEASI